MAVILKDALVVCSATHNLQFFLDDGKDMDMLLGALRSCEVETCEDFRFTLVTGNEVDPSAVGEFCVGGTSVGLSSWFLSLLRT